MVTHIDGISPNLSKITATGAACVVSSFITYPAEMYRESFTKKALSDWNFEKTSKQTNQLTKKLINFTNDHKKKQKLRLVISPLFRIISHEVSITATTSMIADMKEKPLQESFVSEILAGAISGFCQALLLCPLEAHRANQIKDSEEKQLQTTWNRFKQWTHGQLFAGGTSDPVERRTRAYQGVGILAVREIVFNISFFPLFNGFQRYLNSNMEWNGIPTQKNDDTNHRSIPSHSKVLNMLTSGMLAGTTCSLVVTPMDVFKTYYMHSREKWSLWSGTKVFAPPMKLLFRGLTLQACVFGPTFGIVASIYEVT